MSQSIKALFLLALLIKLIIALFIPLTLDEYYYLVWGQNPQLSYFDHPPMVGWLMIVGNFFKNITAGAIRWPFILLSHATVLIWYFILNGELKEKYLFYFLLVAFLNPLWGAGAFISTPDIPLIFFWSLSILLSIKLYHKPSALNYSLLGASLGLGFLAKYQIVLFIPCLALFIYYKKALRNLLTTKILFTLTFGLIFSLPVLIWNYQNDWASFDFQWNHGMKSDEWKWYWPIEYVLSQFLLIFPVFAVLAFKKRTHSSQLSSLHCFALFPLLFFLYSSFKSHVEANWAIMAFPSIYALAFIHLNNNSLQWVKRTLIFWSILLGVAISLIFFTQNNNVKKLRLFESAKFEKVLLFSKESGDILPFSYQMTSYLSFHLDQNICKFPKYGRVDFFNFSKKCSQLPNHFYYILPHGYTPPVEKDFPNYKVIKKIEIDGNYFALEVLKRLRKFFLVFSFIILTYFSYGLYLSTYHLNIFPKKNENIEHHLFHDYKGVTHVVSSFSKGSSTPKDILLEAVESDLDFLFFTDLNLLDRPYDINGYHGDIFTFSNQKLSYLDAHILVYTDNPFFHFNSLSASTAQLSQHFTEPKSEDRNYLTVLAHPLKFNHTWTGPYPEGLDGIEVINLRHLWQQVWIKDKKTFLWSILTYPFNPEIALLRLISDPKKEIELWDYLNKSTPTLGFLGNETTAKIFKVLGLNFTFPSYSKSFSFASNHILLSSELTGHAETDRNKLFSSVKKGHFYLAFDTIGETKGFAAYITQGEETYLMGSELTYKKKMELHVDLPEKIEAPFIVEIYKDGSLFMKSNKIKTVLDVNSKGVYRVKVKIQPKLPLPDDGKWFGWIYTNPFFIK